MLHDPGVDLVSEALAAQTAAGLIGTQTGMVAALQVGTDTYLFFNSGGVGNVVADQIEKQTGFETRCVVLGHLQRGGPPSAGDRVLATRLGLAAGNLVLQKRFGTMVALSGTNIIETTLAAGVASSKTLDLSYYNEAAAFFR